MNNTKYLNAILTVLAVLFAMNLWVGVNTTPGTSLEGTAIAQGRVDAGQQRTEMIAQLKELKTAVSALSSKLSDGSVKVKVEGEPNKD